MLKTIPKIISPELMKIMMEMGHSDVLILADANFPAAAHAKRLIRAEGVEVPELLEAILPYFPLDDFVDAPVRLMPNLSTEPVPEIWDVYEKIIRNSDEAHVFKKFAFTDRLKFYKKAEEAYVIVQTATTARYANIVLQKGAI